MGGGFSGGARKRIHIDFGLHYDRSNVAVRRGRSGAVDVIELARNTCKVILDYIETHQLVVSVFEMTGQFADVRFDQAHTFDVAPCGHVFHQVAEVLLKLINALPEREEALVGTQFVERFFNALGNVGKARFKPNMVDAGKYGWCRRTHCIGLRH